MKIFRPLSRIAWISALALGLTTPSVSQDRYAVIVGVEKYDTSTFDNLDFANEDASQLGSVLRDLDFKTMVLTSDASSSRLIPTTPAKIIQAMKTVTGSCAVGDTLIFCLSGHGVQFSDEPLLPTGIRETYFCPQDADISDKTSLLKISDVASLMKAAPAGRKLLLIDSCRESMLSKKGKKKAAKRIELGSVHENRRAVPEGMEILFSCKNGQFSWEHEPLGHSVFCFHVIKYLKGDAESRYYDSENAELHMLVAYVSKKTNEYVFYKNLSPDGQLPIRHGSSANWTIGRIRRAPASQMTSRSTGMQFVAIPRGEFKMGSPELENDRDERDEQQHRVRIQRDLAIGKFEVTRKEYALFAKSNHQTLADFDSGKLPGDKLQPDTAMVNVTVQDAQSFCKWMSGQDGQVYRLPTEAEWEYACQAGNDNAYNYGPDFRDLDRYAWYDKNTYELAMEYPQPVGRKLPNAFGVYDMHGNAAEMCSDFYDSDYYQESPMDDPTGPRSGRRNVLRGGSWASLDANCRSADRSYVRGQRSDTMGFRVALEIPR